jgi:small subunit ribosomal protein S35
MQGGGRTAAASHWLVAGCQGIRAEVVLREKFTTPSAIDSSMASVTRRLLLQSRRCPSSISSRSTPKYISQWQRPLSTTTRRCARDDNREGARREAGPPAKAIEEATWANTPDKTAAQLQKLVEDLKALDPEIVDDAVRRGKQGIPFAKEFELEKDEDFDIVEDDSFRVKTGFWAEGEASMGPDEDYYGDDITSHGHGELQKHRELREYARLIAWELPLLSRACSQSILN